MQLKGFSFLGNKAPINPQCDGRVWKRSSDLIFYMWIAGDQGQLGTEKRWQAPVQKVIDLIKQWREAGKGE